MAEIPTAESVIRKQFCEGEFDEIMGYLNNSIEPDITQAMIEFAKMHVEAALKEASRKAYVEYVDLKTKRIFDYTDVLIDDGIGADVNKKSILNSYPLTNIK